MTIYQRIQELSKQRNISIRQLELTLGFSNGTLSGWKKSAPTERLLKVANYLDTTPNYLLTGKNDTDSGTEKLEKSEQQLVAAFRKNTDGMSDDEKKQFTKSLHILMQTAKDLLDDNQ